METLNQIFLIGDTTYQRVFNRNNEANLIEVETPKYLTLKQSKNSIYN